MFNKNENLSISSVYKKHRISSTIICEDVFIVEETHNSINQKIENYFNTISNAFNQYISEYEINLELKCSFLPNQNEFQVLSTSIIMFFPLENGEWESIQNSFCGEMSNKKLEVLVKKDVQNILNNYQNVINSQPFTEYDYIKLEHNEIILLFNIILQYFSEREDCRILDEDDCFHFINSNGDVTNLTSKTDINSNASIGFEKIANITTKRVLQEGIKYIKVNKLLNYSTIINFNKGD
ncbi:hypothetical protein ACFCYN_25385, partial [Gottfriedia sp. NPDC056225]|uniref:hypothetical protein n=1 Tax=Gottfriedia sp. NPDC056225 TaxID=3345751 RepID=UPI0035D8B2A9